MTDRRWIVLLGILVAIVLAVTLLGCASLKAAGEHATQIGLATGVGGGIGVLVGGVNVLVSVAVAAALSAITVILATPPVVILGAPPPPFWIAHPVMSLLLAGGVYLLWIRREWVKRTVTERGFKARVQALAHGFVGTKRPTK